MLLCEPQLVGQWEWPPVPSPYPCPHPKDWWWLRKAGRWGFVDHCHLNERCNRIRGRCGVNSAEFRDLVMLQISYSNFFFSTDLSSSRGQLITLPGRWRCNWNSAAADWDISRQLPLSHENTCKRKPCINDYLIPNFTQRWECCEQICTEILLGRVNPTLNSTQIRTSNRVNLNAVRALGNLTAAEFDIHIVWTSLFRLILTGVDTIPVICNLQLQRTLFRVLQRFQKRQVSCFAVECVEFKGTTLCKTT